MTAQAMTLSLEQQTQQRRPQAPAQAPGAASQTPAPAISPKPKKALAPQEEPERELESVGASLEVRSGGQAEGWVREWEAGSRAAGMGDPGWGAGEGREDAAKMPSGPSSQFPGHEGLAPRVETCLAGLPTHVPFLTAGDLTEGTHAPVAQRLPAETGIFPAVR